MQPSVVETLDPDSAPADTARVVKSTSCANVDKPLHPPESVAGVAATVSETAPYVPSPPMRIPPPLHIRWSGHPIFEGEEEECTAYRMSGRPNVGFFAFGLRYKPGMAAPNIFRTIVITNIVPDVVSLTDILQKVRGGELISGKFVSKLLSHIPDHNIYPLRTFVGPLSFRADSVVRSAASKHPQYSNRKDY